MTSGCPPLSTVPMVAGGLFANRAPAAMPERPTLMVVVDTEEEFDWEAPFSRDAISVTAMRHIDRTQRLCDAAGVAPTYVIDYPVATQAAGYEAIAAWAREGRCRIGAHLHPWVTPPFDEAVNARNSFMCNLPPPLQRAKLRELCDAIRANTGVSPTVFKAGRYGIGGDGVALFGELGLAIDVSVNPCMNFAADGGPDFSAFDSRPFWIDRPRALLEVPCTHGFVGWARGRGGWLRDRAAALPAIPGPGILSRCGAVNRVMLSPEGNTLDEMIALTRALLADGLTVFSLTFHSPSVVPGHTEYVRSDADLTTFLTAIERYFEFFFGELEGQPSTPERFRQELLGTVSPAHA
jgi:hypothetical protein